MIAVANSQARHGFAEEGRDLHCFQTFCGTPKQSVTLLDLRTMDGTLKYS